MTQASKDQSRREAIAGVVAEYEQSGLTRRSFSAQAGIAVSTLDYWRRQVRERNRARIVPVKIEAAEPAYPYGETILKPVAMAGEMGR